jgi:NTE family protein
MSIADLPRPVGYVLGGGGSLGAIQVGMLQALSEHDIAPDIVAGTSVGSLNGAVIAFDPTSAANRLSHLWARLTREQVFPGGLLHQARTLQHAKTHLFASTGLATVIDDFLGPEATFADLALPFTAMAMDIATARPHVLSDGPLRPALLASSAIPGIFPPVEVGPLRLYDGGLVANVPLRNVPVVYLHGPEPLRVSPLDFRQTGMLIETSYEAARSFLRDLDITGPGLYGSP